MQPKRVIWFLAVLLAMMNLAPMPARAAEVRVCTALVRYDVDSTTPTACRVEGQLNDPCGAAISGPGLIKSGANPSAAITSNTALSAALAPVAVGDILYVRTTPTIASPTAEPFTTGWAAVVTVKTDNDTVTVDPTVSWLAGFPYSYEKTVCGTTAADGWINTTDASAISMTISYDQGDLDNLSWQFQCRVSAPSAGPQIVYPSEGDDCGNAGTQSAGFCDFATPGATSSFTWNEFGAWSACRIVFKRKTTDTSDAGANLERVTGTIVVKRQE